MSIINTVYPQSGTNTSDATATAAQILSPYTAYVAAGKVTGSMPNNGAVSQGLTPGEQYTIPAGYHNGTGIVTCNKPIFGVLKVNSINPISSTKISYTLSKSLNLSQIVYFGISRNSVFGIGRTGNQYILSLSGTNMPVMGGSSIPYIVSFYHDEASESLIRVASTPGTIYNPSNLFTLSGNTLTFDISWISSNSYIFNVNAKYNLELQYST